MPETISTTIPITNADLEVSVETFNERCAIVRCIVRRAAVLEERSEFYSWELSAPDAQDLYRRLITNGAHPYDRIEAIKVPRRFYDDHADRGLAAGKVMRSNKSYRWVALLPEDRAELIHDARYYSDPETARQMGMSGVVKSAQALVRILTTEA